MLLDLTRAVEARHPWTRGHAARVAELALAVAHELGWGEHRLEAVRLGSLLHDVGKLALPAPLLGKPGPLSATELAAVRRHPATGAELVGSVPQAAAALPCVLHHHERWDGVGYPTRIAGGAIPPEARLVALADAFDAMTSHRPYRRALSAQTALAEIERCAGTQFDPLLASVCGDVWSAQVQVAV